MPQTLSRPVRDNAIFQTMCPLLQYISHGGHYIFIISKNVSPNDHKFRLKIPKAEADFIRPSALDMDFEMDRWNC